MATGLGAITDAQAFGGQMAYKTIEFETDTPVGAIGEIDLFTVTGAVVALTIAVCTENLASGGTVEVGTTANPATIIAQTTASTIDIGEIWVDNSPTVLECWTTAFGCMIGDGADIVLTVRTDPVTDGTLVFTCFWTPLTGDAYVAAA